MEKGIIKVGASDVVGIGLGLLGWIFPQIPEWVKVTVTIIVVLIFIFLAMSQSQRATIAASLGNAFVNFIIPFFAGAFKAVFVTTILIVIADALGIHLVHHDYKYFGVYVDSHDSSNGGFISFFFHTLGNLTTAGNVIVIGAAVIAGFMNADQAKKKIA